MVTVNLKSSERNNLVRLLEHYEKYIREDITLSQEYTQLEIEDIAILRRRIMGQAPKREYRVAKNLDISVFGLGEDHGE